MLNQRFVNPPKDVAFDLLSSGHPLVFAVIHSRQTSRLHLLNGKAMLMIVKLAFNLSTPKRTIAYDESTFRGYLLLNRGRPGKQDPWFILLDEDEQQIAASGDEGTSMSLYAFADAKDDNIPFSINALFLPSAGAVTCAKDPSTVALWQLQADFMQQHPIFNLERSTQQPDGKEAQVYEPQFSWEPISGFPQ